MALSQEVWSSAVDMARHEIEAMRRDYEELAVDDGDGYWQSHVDRCDTALSRLENERWGQELLSTVNNVLMLLDEEDAKLGYRKSSLSEAVDRHTLYSGIDGTARHFERLALICSMEKEDIGMTEAVAKALASGRIIGPIPAFQEQQSLNLACAHRGDELFLVGGDLVESQGVLGIGYLDLRVYEADAFTGKWHMTNRAVSSTRGDLKKFAIDTLRAVQPLSVMEGSDVEMVEIAEDLMRTTLEGESLSVSACIDLLAEKLGPDVDLSIPAAYRDDIAEYRCDTGIDAVMHAAHETADISNGGHDAHQIEPIDMKGAIR